MELDTKDFIENPPGYGSPFLQPMKGVGKFAENTGLDNVESDKTPGYYIGSKLIAKKYVTIYKLPDVSSKVMVKVPPGHEVGKVQSYLVRKNITWWQLENHEGYVQQFPGYFDEATAKATSSGKKFNEDMAKANEFGNPLEELFKSFSFLKHWKIIAVIIAILIVSIAIIKIR